MTKVLMICLALMMLIAGFLLPATAQDRPSVAGEWYGTYSGTGGEKLEFFLTLKQDGEKVSGTYYNPGAGAARRAITNNVSGYYRDGVLVIEKGLNGFKGTVTGDKMAGGMLSGTNQQLTFAATKTK